MNRRINKFAILLLVPLMIVALMLPGCSGEKTIKYEDATYYGEIKDGQPHGQGTETLADGTVRSGRWEDGKYIGH